MTTGFFGTGAAAAPAPAAAPAGFGLGINPSGTVFGSNVQGPTGGAFGSTLFGSTSTPSVGGLAGGAATTSSGFTIGSAGTLFSSTSVPATQNLFSTFGTTVTSATKPTFGSALTAATTTAAAPGTGGFFGFNNPTSGLAASGTGFGLTLTAPFTGSGFNKIPSFGTTSTAPVGVSAAPISGLGGIDLTQTSGTAGTVVSTKNDNKVVKEILVPNEILATVEAFKKYVKDQKNIREEITRISSKSLFKVEEEILSLKNVLSVVSNDIQRNVSVVEKLKRETVQELKNAEIAQRTKDTPLGLQYENTAPTEYFQQLIIQFEMRMKLYRTKIDQMEKYLSLSQTSNLSSGELAMMMKKLHETFIAMAAELQTVHEAVKVQKEHYINYRKIFHHDTSNCFKTQPATPSKIASYHLSTTVGPTPFSGMSSAAAAAMASATALNRTQQPTGYGPSTACASSGFDTRTPTHSYGLLGSGEAFSPSSTLPSMQKPLLLQKPPLGNKRGKRMAHN